MPEFAECIHIQAAVIITIQLDAIHYVTPSIEFMGTYVYYSTRSVLRNVIPVC